MEMGSGRVHIGRKFHERFMVLLLLPAVGVLCLCWRVFVLEGEEVVLKLAGP